MIYIFEKHQQLRHIEKAERRRFGINKYVLIASLILFAMMIFIGQLLLIPAVMVLMGGFAYSLVGRKPKKQRAALTQIKLLRQVVKETMLAKGMGADRVAEVMKDYFNLIKQLEYDAAVQQQFTTLCEGAGVGKSGAFVDKRFL